MEEVVYENQFVCRACLKIVEQKTQSFGYVDDATGNLRDMLMCCVPEMDVYISSNPVICFSCIQTLIHVYNFKSRCINTETIIRTYMQKYNMTDQNPINLGSVVRDLVQLNNILKQQEERKRQFLMEQRTLANSLQHPQYPPPLRFRESGSLAEQSPILGHFLQAANPHNPHNAEPSFERMHPMLIVQPPSIHHPPPAVVSTAQPNTFFPPMGPAPPLRPAPFHVFNGYGAATQIPPLVAIPVKPAEPSVESSANKISNDVTPDSGNISNKVLISDSNENSIDADVERTKKSDKISEKVKKIKPYVHPIESKMRLVVRIPRSKLMVPFKGDKTPSLNHNDSSSSNETNTGEQEAIPEGNEIIPDDQEATNFEQEMQIGDDDPINNIKNYYNPEDGGEMPPNSHITKLYNCSCMYLTTSPSLFEEHKKRCKTAKIVSPQNLFKCPHCPHITNRMYALDKHINNMHTKAQWFACEVCTYRSTDKSCLRRHVRKHHEQSTSTEQSRQFPCQICEMLCSSEYNLRRHLLKHEENEVTYNCEFCWYQSKDRSNYRKHLFTHSPNTLQCPACSYNNVSPYTLKHHIKRNHNGVGIEAVDCKSEVPVVQLVEELRALINKTENNDCFSRQFNDCSEDQGVTDDLEDQPMIDYLLEKQIENS